MSTITIPASLQAAFTVTEPSQVCDEKGNVIGYYTPVRDTAEEAYNWAMKHIAVPEIEASLESGMGRPLSEIVAELRSRQGR